MAWIRKGMCPPHTSGVGPDAPKFFYVGCLKCEEKKKAGKVTGKEGPLPQNWRRIRTKPTLSPKPRPKDIRPYKK